MPSLHHNEALGRYELSEQGAVVFADYRRVGDQLFIDHVEAPPQLRGTGAAGRFMEALAAEAKDKRLTLVPICSYAVHWLRTHAELAQGVSIAKH